MLDSVERRTFDYFWSGAEPNSGLACERINMDGIYPENDETVVTTGGSGFGILALIAGMERGYVTREQGIERFERIVSFLERADRFHGAWPHWIEGRTGRVKPFGKKDNGGDLVETAFLVQGCWPRISISRRGNEREQALAQRIDTLWRGVEWSWYRNGQNVLYWHWSPEYGWEMNFAVHGFNECLVMYILAAASPTYPIDREVYTEGWAENGAIVDEHEVEGYRLPPAVSGRRGRSAFLGALLLPRAGSARAERRLLRGLFRRDARLFAHQPCLTASAIPGTTRVTARIAGG